ncbi:MAG: cobalt-precorrin-6A reductase [Boseongicola sp. SB0664_bin_43]|uniref:Cobalt-precorrin-6A reductase n=1 Tax=Boseongicola sp. SB0664_bin_43 TaxID=2604844 RepID=A0A6B0Y466_9RHOB|nr:cobalt-precorrin-6A reductase [Boseongicola sp. SB0664_bin_43]MYK30808.1 cobalt-precorrin-6A reductase [Boseongicola sp. SB0670_bin_30]
MAPNLLILGGSAEASALAAHVAGMGLRATFSYAGRVANPVAQPLPTRTGGFGGAAGLAAYLQDHSVSHLVDATNPFAAQMSRNAVAACAAAGVPMIALARPPWTPGPGDRWTRVSSVAEAARSLGRTPRRIFLAIGRTRIPAFETAPQHHYLLRFVDVPKESPALPHHDVIIDRGPFSEPEERDLLETHGIDLLVSRNAGGEGARAKIDAARGLGLPILMIDRPDPPQRPEVGSVEEVLDWIAHSVTDRGV